MKCKTSHILSGLLVCALSSALRGEEGGSGHYLPGSMSSFLDAVPPKETFIVRYNLLYYEGVRDIKSLPLPIAGLDAAGVNASSWANGLTFLWRPSVDLGSDRLSYALSATIPVVSMDVSAQVGPINRSDQLDALGDIVLMPLMFNYQFSEDFNASARLGIYAPTGDYEVGRLANTGKNFWTFEPTVGLMYFGKENGIEASLFNGVSLNTENEDTNYQSGAQFHVDGTLAQHFPIFGGLAGVGLNGYWYEQVVGDRGTGAFLGDFKGRTAGLGPVLSFAGKLGGLDMVTELKWLHEMETKNRLQGDYVWLKVVLKF
ncbi:MAG: transporter [Verrucomicrobiae bacterium]|nr:transporter [Verrucomicrobiae bacterium]